MNTVPAFSHEARVNAFARQNHWPEIQKFFNTDKFYELNKAKKWNRALGHSIKRLFPDDDKRINRVFSCGNNTSVVYSPSLGRSHTEAFWCDERCCAICNFYKSRSLFSRVYSYVRENSDKQYLFLTLTVRNVPGSELRETVKRMNRAFGRMFKLRDERSKAGKMFSGYIRRLEITYQSDPTKDSYRTFHPHLHVLLECKPEYKPRSDCFYHRLDILRDWQYYFGDPEITQIKIKQIRPTKIVDPSVGYDKAIAGACAEVCKYPLKLQQDLLKPENNELFDEFISGMFTLKGCIFETVSKNFKHILHFVSKPQEGDPLPDVLESPDAAFQGYCYSQRKHCYIKTPIFLLRQRDKFGYSANVRFKAWCECVKAWDHGLLDGDDPPEFQ